MASALAPASSDEPRPARPSRRRLYWFIAVIVAAFAGSFAVLLFSDAPPPDISDLAPIPARVADADNLILQVIETGKQFAVAKLFSDAEIAAFAPLPPDVSVDPFALPQKHEEGDGWTEETLAKRKPEASAIIQVVQRLQRHTASQARAPESAADFEDIFKIRQFYTRLQLAIWATYHGGDQTLAAELALAGLHMGKTIRDARGPSFVYDEGTDMITAFQGTLHRLAAQPDATRDTLAFLLRGTSETELMPDGYEHALRSDFSWTAKHLAKMNADEARMDFAAARHFQPFVRTRVLFPLIYKRNATTDLLADAIREEIRLSRKAPKNWPAPKPVHPSGSMRRPWNAYGQTLIAFVSSSISDNPSREERWLTHTRQKALRTYVALRLFHVETGHLPESLDELVPHHLPAVPEDDVDGARLRYSPIIRAIWSRGFQDPAGLVVTSADQKVDEKEVFYRLDFAAPLRSPDAATKKPRRKRGLIRSRNELQRPDNQPRASAA
jgi:hypothetical protein